MKKYLVLSGVLSLFSCSAINQRLGLEDDNFAEEIVEEAVKAKTGLDLDFTPQTHEKSLLGIFKNEPK